jgi:uncharacterized membrane protein YqaE (UPF0057 family)
MSEREGYLHDYVAAGLIGYVIGWLGLYYFSGAAYEWGIYVAIQFLASLIGFIPGGFVAAYINFRFHRVEGDLKMAGLTAGFISGIVHALYIMLIILYRAASSDITAFSAASMVVTMIFGFVFYSIGGYICGHLEETPLAMPAALDLSRLVTRAPPPPPAAETHMCSGCGKPLTYIKQYDKWYCHECKKYA